MPEIFGLNHAKRVDSASFQIHHMFRNILIPGFNTDEIDSAAEGCVGTPNNRLVGEGP